MSISVAPICLLDGDMTVAHARRRLQLNADVSVVVVRRQQGGTVCWHAFTSATMGECLAGAADEAVLKDVPGIEWYLTRVVHVVNIDDDSLDEPRASGLLVDGDRPVGWIQVARAESGTRGDLAHVGGGPDERQARRGTAAFGAVLAGYAGQLRDLIAAGVKGSPGAAGAGTTEHRPAEGTFEAYPLIEVPEAVDPDADFTIQVGLSPSPAAGAGGSFVAVPGVPEGAQSIEIGMRLMADGFTVGGANAARYLLTVPVANPAVSVIVHARAAGLAAGADPRLASVKVQFTYGGAPCGFAYRKFQVRHPGPGRLWRGPGGARNAAGPSLSLSGGTPPDLTVTIVQAGVNYAQEGEIRWSFDSPHLPGSGGADATTFLGGGADAQTFAKSVLHIIERDDGRDAARHNIEGMAEEISQRVPHELWSALRQVADAVKPARTPSVLLLTDEPYVPWELARVDESCVLDPEKPPILGVQFNLARWILGANGRPPVPPPRTVHVRTIAVVTGEYQGGDRLPHGVAEGQLLREQYQALPFAMTARDVGRLLDGDLEVEGKVVNPELIHFACHGEADSDHPLLDALVLEDSETFLTPFVFAGARIGRKSRPFVFFNACQVGGARRTLGQYSGFVGSCLRNQFRGFVAPLWTVRDDMALEIARDFYERALRGDAGREVRVAELLREIRGKYRPDERPTRTTPLAYVYYGHPDLVITFGPGDEPDA